MPANFDEDAFLLNNPDIANAVASHAVTSGKAWYEALGGNQPRQTCRRSATLMIPGPQLTTAQVAGIWVQLKHGMGDLPPTITCVLHGEGGAATPVRLRPAEGKAQYETYFLPKNIAAPSHQVLSVELQFEGVVDPDNSFGIDELRLYGH